MFAYFRYSSISSVICEEKHMGSRAIVVMGRDAATIERRFGITGQGVGACYTRTGRRFFEDRTIEAQFLLRVCDALTATGLWAELGTNWVVLDSELMPWSFKAQELLREQYAAVGVAASTSLKVARQLLGQAGAYGILAKPILDGVPHVFDDYCRRLVHKRRLVHYEKGVDVAETSYISALPHGTAKHGLHHVAFLSEEPAQASKALGDSLSVPAVVLCEKSLAVLIEPIVWHRLCLRFRLDQIVEDDDGQAPSTQLKSVSLVMKSAQPVLRAVAA